MNATKFEKTRIHFKSDVFPTVAVVDAKAPWDGVPGVKVFLTCAIICRGGWDDIVHGLKRQHSTCWRPISPLWFLRNLATGCDLTAPRLAQLDKHRSEPRPGQHSGPSNKWEESATFVKTSANGRPPLTTLAHLNSVGRWKNPRTVRKE